MDRYIDTLDCGQNNNGCSAPHDAAQRLRARREHHIRGGRRGGGGSRLRTLVRFLMRLTRPARRASEVRLYTRLLGALNLLYLSQQAVLLHRIIRQCIIGGKLTQQMLGRVLDRAFFLLKLTKNILASQLFLIIRHAVLDDLHLLPNRRGARDHAHSRASQQKQENGATCRNHPDQSLRHNRRGSGRM